MLIYGDGSACIADFGLSLMYSEIISASQASCTSTLKGNVRWMAPELLLLEQEDGPPPRPSEQSDIFSFGGIMLLVGLGYFQPLDDNIILAFRSSPTKHPIITYGMILPSSGLCRSLNNPPDLVILCSPKNTGSSSSNVGLQILGTVHRRRELTKRSGMNFTRCLDLELARIQPSVYSTTRYHIDSMLDGMLVLLHRLAPKHLLQCRIIRAPRSAIINGHPMADPTSTN